MPGPGFLDLPVRPGKPRRTGITHVLDRGLPLAQAAEAHRYLESRQSTGKLILIP